MARKNKKYEDYSDIIDEALKKQRSKWRLDAVQWLGYDDVEQIIRAHIAKKWRMWDQRRPFEPWVNRVISNQLRNLLRNNYGAYAKPCSQCEYARGDLCMQTDSGQQSNECSLYSAWSKKKKYGLGLNTALSIEDEDNFINIKCDFFDYDNHLDRLNKHMKEMLSEHHYIAYRMMFFENRSEEEVAIFMGYKISENNNKLGYRQVKNLKRKFTRLAAKILKEKDILEDETK